MVGGRSRDGRGGGDSERMKGIEFFDAGVVVVGSVDEPSVEASVLGSGRCS